MKLFVTIVLLCLVNTLHANRIDSLKSDREVIAFVSELALKDYNSEIYTISFRKKGSSPDEVQCEKTFFKSDNKNWEKADFNRDNLTDLFAIVSLEYKNNAEPFYKCFAIVDNGRGQFIVHEIDNFPPTSCNIVKLIYIDEQPAIVFGHYRTRYTTDSLFDIDTPYANDPPHNAVKYIDTLVYKYESFIELNRDLKNQKIKSIFFETGICFGQCPVFNMSVYDDGSAKYAAIGYNSKTGDFKATISKDKMDSLMGLINYLNILSLDNLYATQATIFLPVN
ncbi:DUF6438 domain-containing protein [Ferruginibacter sp.]